MDNEKLNNGLTTWQTIGIGILIIEIFLLLVVWGVIGVPG